MSDDRSPKEPVAMPQRPRSHQLEERSRIRFRDRLPDHMIARDKTNDYGVDLEVEIFNRDTTATGLACNVQIKATDDPKRRQEMRLTRAQRNYLESLPIRSLLVRWCSLDSSFYWKWLDNTPDVADEADSQTIKFSDDDAWTDSTPDEIEAALRAWRAIDRHPPHAPVHVALNLEEYSPARRQALTTSVRRLIDETNALTLEPAVERLTLRVTVTANTVVVSVGTIARVEAEAADLLLEDLTTLIRYALTALLARLKLNQHADLLARGCLAKGATSPSPDLALRAVRALTSSAQKSVELAILNELHIDPFAPMLIFMYLKTTPYEPDDQGKAHEQFLRASFSAADSAGDSSKLATICYSLGNHFSNSHEYAKAISAFNRARKLRPKYAESGYFLSEVAGALFGAGHFVMSARIYEQAIARDTSARLSLYFGDSLLFSGRLAGAAASFNDAAAQDASAIQAEALMKADVCEWLIALYGARIERRRAAAIKMERSDASIEQRILAEFDALDEIANWNVAIAHTRSGRYGDALPHFLICAFRSSGDQEAWTNALLCTINMADAAMLQAVLRCALALGGPTAADGFCERLSGNDEMATDLSGTIARFNEEFAADKMAQPTLRILRRNDDRDDK